MRKQHRYAARMIALAAVWLLCSAPSPQGVLTVLMVPFHTDADTGLGYIAKSMNTLLPARIAKQGRILVIDAASLKKPPGSGASDNRLRDAALGVKADFILDGTVSRHDSAVDVTARLIEVSPPGTVSRLFMRAAMIDNLIPETDTLAASLRDIILRSSPAPADQSVFRYESAAGPRAVPAQALPPVPARARPGRIVEETLSESDMPSPETAVAPGQARPLFEPSPFVTLPLRAITLQTVTAGDIDADSKRELIAAAPGSITIYSLSGTALIQKHAFTAASHERIIDVGAGDLNGNGLEEIYVTCQSANSAASFVLELGESGFTRLTPSMPWFFRVYDDPAGELVLLGQKASGTLPAPEELYRLHWQEGTLRRGHKIELPEGLAIYAFSGVDFAGDGRPACLAFTPAGGALHRLCLYGPAGGLQWSDPGEPGFSPRSFQRYGGTAGRNEPIPLRIICRDLDLDGAPEILIAKNTGQPGSLREAALTCLRWDGSAMNTAWTSPQFDARISDYTLADLDNDGAAELYVLSISSAGLFGRVTSTITGFRPGR